MKRSLLLQIKRIQVIKPSISLFQHSSTILMSLILIVFTNNVQAQIPCALTVTHFVTNPTCNGLPNGTINITMNGGASPYTFNWSNGDTTEDLVGLSASTYSVIVTDNSGCKDTAIVPLSQPLPLINTIQKQDVLCYGGNTGSINTNVSGGTGPYNYFWSNGMQNANIVNLVAGRYIVTVYDYHGCGRKDTISILQPDLINLQLISPEPIPGYNISSYLGNDGSIDLSVTGGVSPYTYAWSNSAVTQDLNNLTAGLYNVSVTDSNHCTSTGSITLDQPVEIVMPSGFTPNSDGQNDNFVVHGIEEYQDNMLTIFNRWGNIVYKKQAYNNQWNGYNNKGEELPDATYFAILEIKSKDLVLKGYVELKRH